MPTSPVKRYTTCQKCARIPSLINMSILLPCILPSFTRCSLVRRSPPTPIQTAGGKRSTTTQAVPPDAVTLKMDIFSQNNVNFSSGTSPVNEGKPVAVAGPHHHLLGSPEEGDQLLARQCLQHQSTGQQLGNWHNIVTYLYPGGLPTAFRISGRVC